MPADSDLLLGRERLSDVGRPGGVGRVGAVERAVHEGAAAAAPVKQERRLAIRHRPRVGASTVGDPDEILPHRLSRPDQPLPAIPVLRPRTTTRTRLIRAVRRLLEILVHQTVDVRADLLPPGHRVGPGVAVRVSRHIPRRVHGQVITLRAQRVPDGRHERQRRRCPLLLRRVFRSFDPRHRLQVIEHVVDEDAVDTRMGRQVRRHIRDPCLLIARAPDVADVVPGAPLVHQELSRRIRQQPTVHMSK